MTRAYALARAASAFLSALVRRRPEAVAPLAPETPEAPEALRVALDRELRQAGIENRCPVCQARFRGARTCSRCGASLEPLMRLTVKAWQLRQAARQALGAGDAERALGLASEAQAIQSTGNGEALGLLGAWLTTGVPPSRAGQSWVGRESDIHP